MTVDVRQTGLPNCKWHGPGARVGCREFLCLPQCDRISMQVSKSRFVKKTRTDDRCEVALHGPRPTRISASDAWCAGGTYGVLRIVVEEAVQVHAEHQRLLRIKFVVHASIKKRLAVVTDVSKIPIGRQHKRRQTGRQKRCSVLPGIVGRGEEESSVFD